MRLAQLVPPFVIAAMALALVWYARRLRPQRKGWPLPFWLATTLGGAVAAIVVRAAEALIVDVAAAGQLEGAETVRNGLVAFGVVGPLTVLALAAIVWTVVTQGLSAEVDPPIAAAAAASGFVIGRMLTVAIIERGRLGSGVRAGVLAIDDIALAMTWGYGLARSSFDGKLGGTPFGRYALLTMLARGGVELAMRSRAPLGLALSAGVGLLCGTAVAMGVYRIARGPEVSRPSLAVVGQETIRAIARAQLERGGVRPLWIGLGALGNLGGMVLGFALAVIIGRSARIDFGEIDRNGPAAEYAALLLALGVVMSFPVSAAIVGLAGGGRATDRPYVLEAGLSAILALGALLVALGVVAPVAVAIGIACAPVAFVLAGLGAWIAAGRRN
jgi:hypothetical protein